MFVVSVWLVPARRFPWGILAARVTEDCLEADSRAGSLGLSALAMFGLYALHGRQVCTTLVICVACWSVPSGPRTGEASVVGGHFNKCADYIANSDSFISLATTIDLLQMYVLIFLRSVDRGKNRS